MQLRPGRRARPALPPGPRPPPHSCEWGGRHCCAVASVKTQQTSSAGPGPQRAPKTTEVCARSASSGGCHDSRLRERSKPDHILFGEGEGKSKAARPAPAGARSCLWGEPCGRSRWGKGISYAMSNAASGHPCFSVDRPLALSQSGPAGHSSSEFHSTTPGSKPTHCPVLSRDGITRLHFLNKPRSGPLGHLTVCERARPRASAWRSLAKPAGGP